MDAKKTDHGFLERLSRAANDELGGLFSARMLADFAAKLPGSAFARTRTALFRAAGVTIGERSQVGGAMRITGRASNPCSLLSIGDDTLITGDFHVDLGAPVRIGDWVRIGHDVTVLTINHAIGPSWFRAGTSYFREVVIENGVWIASRATVLPGVTLGAGSIVAAGAVVARNVAPNTLVAGVPARVVRELSGEGEMGSIRRGENGYPEPVSR
jgi:maltose O-acetyltransferase